MLSSDDQSLTWMEDNVIGLLEGRRESSRCIHHYVPRHVIPSIESEWKRIEEGDLLIR